MRVVLDLQCCQSGSRKGGIGRYSLELAKAMARRATDHELFLVLSSLLPEAVIDIRHEFADLIPQDFIKVFDAPCSVAELTNNRTKVRAAELIREEFIRSLDPDVVHVASLFEGLQEDVLTSVGHLFPSNRTAVTLYDLIPYVQRDRYLANSDALIHYLGKIDHLKRAGLLLAISEFSRDEAIGELGISPDRVINISSAADERFRPIALPNDEVVRLREKYGVQKKFLMYTGSFDQRKNHAALITAFGLLPPKIREDHQLLIVGNGWDAVYQSLREIGKRVGLEPDDVVFAGHVSDTDLLPLYNLCHLFVFPSLAEGFGLPVLEAMSCGVPTIGSNCTSIPEVIGWTDALFDPRDPKSIAHKIHQGLTDEGFRSALKANGLRQARKFSWDESARRAIAALESHHHQLVLSGTHQIAGRGRTGQESKIEHHSSELIGKLAGLEGVRRLPDEALMEMAYSIASNQLQAAISTGAQKDQWSNARVGWVTTWNTKCGIASYSDFLIEHFPSPVVILAPVTEETVQPDGGNVIRCWQAGVSDDLHRLQDQIRRMNIEVLVIQFNYSFFDFQFLRDFLQRISSDGVRVYITLHSTQDPAENKRLSLIADALAACGGVIVHSMADVERLRQIGLTENINLCPQGVIEKRPSTIGHLDFGNKKVIATYGFALPSKGLTEVVEALSTLRRDFSVDAHLLMVNAEYPDPRSTALIESIREKVQLMGIQEHVTFVNDYLSDEDSIGYLQHADLVVYPYQQTGESSSAAVRMGLAAGRPVAVTPNKIFEDVQSSVFVLPSDKPQGIAEGIRHVLDLISDKHNDSEAVARNARLWRAAHGYASIARYLYWLTTRRETRKFEYRLAPNYMLSQTSEKLSFMASQPPFKTVVGTNDGDYLCTNGLAGALLFGPFISVAPGQYRAVIHGKSDTLAVGQATVDVAMNGGACTLSRAEASKLENEGILADLSFVVPEGGCRDLEIRVMVDEAASLQLSEVGIEPLPILDL